ncbi:MAG: YqeG family HAD IIIA-type phosphatase [Firmicutes bacterium]|nr:YqeG family HAD IIIA-type phosphatase [Bacillota bacterium]MCL5038960.1 YqeG family HAD IIIA-type phosphatase [Bacillota bacterium]
MRGGVRKLILDLLRPAAFFSSIYQIDLDRLQKRGIKGLIFDLDNTIVEWGSPVAGEELLAWFKALRERGFLSCLLSNNSPARVNYFAGRLGIPGIYKAGKPRRRSYRAALELLGTAPQETAIIGDQVFTDILGGNRLGLYTILVTPLSQREFLGTRLVRRLERLVLGRWLGRFNGT